MNILEFIMGIGIVYLAASGFRKGFVKKLASMLSLVISVVLVSVFLPHITDYLKENTPVYTYIVEQCADVLEEQAGKYRSELQLRYPDTADTQPKTGSMAAFSRIEQTELIEALPLPEFLKDLLLNYNNEEGYSGLRVSNFQDYLVHVIATSILNVLAFLVSIVAVQLLLWAVLTVLNVVSHIPVIRIVNHVAGMGLGLLQALFFAWVFFLLLSLFSGTDMGMKLMEMVQESALLSGLYESNLFLQIVLQAAAIFG